MPLNDITFVKNGNGLGRRQQSNDGIAGLVLYSATLPTGFTSSDRIKVVYSLPEAEALGITKALFAGIHYQVKEFFRGNPDGKLYISINAVPASTYDFNEIKTIVNFSDGEIKLVGVWANALVFAAAQITTLNTIANDLYVAYKPISIFYGAEFSTFTVSSIPTAINNAPYVTVVLAEDGTPNSDGKAVRTSTNKSVAAVGLTLAIASKAKVSDNIGYMKKFNLSDGNNMEVPALAVGSGELIKTLTDSQLVDIKNKSFVFARKYYGFAGTFFEDSPTSDAVTSDFSSLENVRVIHKAITAVRNSLLPELKSNLKPEPDGKLSKPTISKFELAAKEALESLTKANELADFEILINPEQDYQSTSTLEVTLKLQPLAVARFIVVNIGYKK